MGSIALEEYELMKDSKYRLYVQAVDKALKSFEYTSEWADLISALGKLNKVLVSYTKFPVIPRRIKISKRLAQCMHPALPSGVHLRALETYDIIFKCMGTNRLSHELFIYSAGLFPLLGHAAINVRPSLLTVYETHFVPLGKRLGPGLSGFLSGVLPGLEEGSDHFERTNALLEKVCEGVGASHFYGCLWDCLASNAAVRLPAILFALAHYDKRLSTEDQLHVMGTNVDVMVNGLCACVQDTSVLVQRSALDFLLVGFPMHNSQLLRCDMVRLVTAALSTILRRDMSLNRRLYAWLLGSEINIALLSPEHPLVKRSKTADSITSNISTSQYFELYSREMLVLAIKTLLDQATGQTPHDLRPYRLLVSLLDKPDIGPVILDDFLFEVFRLLYLCCNSSAPAPESHISAANSSSSSHKSNSAELVKSANLLFGSLEPRYLWQYVGTLVAAACCTRGGGASCSTSTSASTSTSSWSAAGEGYVRRVGSGDPSLVEVCALAEFLLDTVSLETYSETPTEHLPSLFLQIVTLLTEHCDTLSPLQTAKGLQLCAKILTRVQPTVLAHQSLSQTADTGYGSGGEPSLTSATATEISSSLAPSSIVSARGHLTPSTTPSNSLPGRMDRSPSSLPANVSMAADNASTNSDSMVSYAGEDGAAESKDGGDGGVMTSSTRVRAGEGSGGGGVDEQQNILEQCLRQYEKFYVMFVYGTRLKVGETKSISVLLESLKIKSTQASHEDRAKQLETLLRAVLMEDKEQDVGDEEADDFYNSLNSRVGGGASSLSATTAANQRPGGVASGGGGTDGAGDGGDGGGSETAAILVRRAQGEAGVEWTEAMRVASRLLVDLSTLQTYFQSAASSRLLDGGEVVDSSVGSSLVDSSVDVLPEWLRVLIVCACWLSSAVSLQLIAISTLLDLVTLCRTAQSLVGAAHAQTSVTPVLIVPLLTPAHLRYIEHHTNVFQVIAHRLWMQLGSRVHRVGCVELLHQLQSASCDVVEDCLGEALLAAADGRRLLAFRRFATLWHIGREVNARLGSSLRVSDIFYKSMLKMLDNLQLPESSALKVEAQSWLLHSLLRGDMHRIVDPILMMLLDPATARLSVLHVHIESAPADSPSEPFAVPTSDATSTVYAISSVDGNVIYHVAEKCPKVNFSQKATTPSATSKSKRIFAVTTLAGGGQDSTKLNHRYITEKQLLAGEDTTDNNYQTHSKTLSLLQNISVFVNPFSTDKTTHVINTDFDDYYEEQKENVGDFAGKAVRVTDLDKNKSKSVEGSERLLDKGGGLDKKKKSFAPRNNSFTSLDQELAKSSLNLINPTLKLSSIDLDLLNLSSLTDSLFTKISDGEVTSQASNKDRASRGSVSSDGPSPVEGGGGGGSGEGPESSQLVRSWSFPEKDRKSKKQQQQESAGVASSSAPVTAATLDESTPAEEYNFGPVAAAAGDSLSTSVDDGVVATATDVNGDKVEFAIGESEGTPKQQHTSSLSESSVRSNSTKSSSSTSSRSKDTTIKTPGHARTPRITQGGTQVSASVNGAKLSQPQPQQSQQKSSSVDQLHSHLLLYCGVYDSLRTLYALQTLRNILTTNARAFLCAAATTGLPARSPLLKLLARHRKSIFGRGFGGDLDGSGSGGGGSGGGGAGGGGGRSSMYLEVLICTCLYYMRSYYPNLAAQTKLTHEEISGNRQITGRSPLLKLLARHRKSIFGRGFGGDLDGSGSGGGGSGGGGAGGGGGRSSMYLEVLICTCLYYMRSYYPNLAAQTKLTHEEISGNRQVQICSVELLSLISCELSGIVRDSGHGLACYLNDLLSRVKLQKVALHCVLSIVQQQQQRSKRGGGGSGGSGSGSGRSFTQEILAFNEDAVAGDDCDDLAEGAVSRHSEAFQVQLLRFLLALLMLEHEVNSRRGSSGGGSEGGAEQQTASSATSAGEQQQHQQQRRGSEAGEVHYVAGKVIPQQPMFLAAIVKALEQQGRACYSHTHWTALVTCALPYLGPALTRVVTTVVRLICANIEAVSKAYYQPDSSVTNKTGNGFPADYAITQVEALTVLCHYCLLDSATPFNQPLLAVSGTTPAQIFNNLIHVFMPSPMAVHDQVKERHEPQQAARKAVLGSLPRVISSVACIWQALVSNKERESDNVEAGSPRVVRQQLLEFLSPIALHHGTSFLAAMAVVWRERRPSPLPSSTTNSTATSSALPVASEGQQVLVQLLSAIKAMPIDTLVKTLHEVVRQPALNQETAVSVEVSSLELFVHYVQLIPGVSLSESWPSLLALLREGPSLSPPAQFLLLSALSQFVHRCPPLQDKKDQKDLQDITARLVESCSQIAGACLEQTTWLRRNLAVKEDDFVPQQDKDVDKYEELDADTLTDYDREWPSLSEEKLSSPEKSSGKSSSSRNKSKLKRVTKKIRQDAEKLQIKALHQWFMRAFVHENSNFALDSSAESLRNGSGSCSAAQYSVAAQTVLAQLLAPLLDVSYGSQEKERVVNLLTTIMYNVTPYLKNHSQRNAASFFACSQLLASLSSFQYTRKAWKKDAMDLLLDSALFQMEARSLTHWRQTVDNLMSQDTNTFRDLLGRVSFGQGNSLSIFSSKEQEYEQRAQLLKRLAFVILCSERDQFHKHTPDILERLAESLRLPQAVPGVQAQVFLCFRVLLLRMSPHHVTSLWPIIVSEMVQVMLHMELELSTDTDEFRRNNRYRWAFVESQIVTAHREQTKVDFIPHVTRIARIMDSKFGPIKEMPEGALLPSGTNIQAIRELHPFFTAMSNGYNTALSLTDIEADIELDFLETMPAR
ncbi:protein dopey-1 homolog [Nilaparvata lugens]|uniref:protein dopey-1 homolog n=1 Tax=Nilaparvata lugens TaxID=108931 RepID=UPI00193D7B64|nr:protein dopey-1 homolog [Nilaparvata lugens]